VGESVAESGKFIYNKLNCKIANFLTARPGVRVKIEDTKSLLYQKEEGTSCIQMDQK